MATGPSSTERWTWLALAGVAALVIGLAIARDRAVARTSPEGKPAPRVELPLLEGSGKTAIEPGKVTVVDFWATWCGPCRVSMPRVQQVWKDYTPKGVSLWSVDTDAPSNDREPLVKEFLLQNSLTFPVVLDDESASAQQAFRISSLPTMLVVGRDGKVVWKHIGVLDASRERELRRVLDDALASASR